MAFGRLLLVAGVLLVLAGLLVLLCARLGLPLGRLPGDMRWSGRNWSASFPLMTSILLSVLLSLALYLVGLLRR